MKMRFSTDGIAGETRIYDSLVARARLGDRDAMARLIETNRLFVIKVASNILRDSFEAEDVAQEAFLKAFENLHRLKEERGFRKYLLQIAVRLCLDRLRRKSAEVREEIETVGCQREVISQRLAVEMVLNQMPFNLRAILILREIEQLDYDEIAGILRIPVGTVRSRLHAAREKFRILWTESKGEEC